MIPEAISLLVGSSLGSIAGGDPARFDRFTAFADAIEDFQAGASPR
jgi:hypothetical protein